MRIIWKGKGFVVPIFCVIGFIIGTIFMEPLRGAIGRIIILGVLFITFIITAIGCKLFDGFFRKKQIKVLINPIHGKKNMLEMKMLFYLYQFIFGYIFLLFYQYYL